MASVSRNCTQLQLLTSDDGCVLLDIERDQILKLNSVAAEMWKLLSAGQTESQVAINLSRKYQVSEERVANDVKALVGRIADIGAAQNSIFTDLPEQGIQSSSQPSFPWYGRLSNDRAAKPSVRLILSALLGLLAFDAVLSLFSLNSLCSQVKAWPVKRRRTVNPNTIGQVCGAVDRACIWYPRRTLCLQRSAVTTCLLRSNGVLAQMMIGVRPMPFLAHAWVEANGSVINDWPRVKRFYRSLLAH
jgi:hypothetical protein